MDHGLRSYENLLSLRKHEFTFLWVSRQLNPQIAYKQLQRPTPSSHKDAVLKSPKIQEILDKISEKSGVPKNHLENQVRTILDEIGYNKNLKVIRWLGLILTKISLRISTGIFVNVNDLIKLKYAMGNCPVIFVPSHRSYADFILMSYVSFTYDIEIPAIAAGMDFHGMWGMGSMLRDTGAFFMRRSYNDDSLYWTTFKQYIHQLVTEGDLPIEFFIEGTRSRSNKSLSPKYGLISMILKPFFFSEVPDILFVPISISYDRILEENLFAFELLGVPKPKESTSGFFKSLKIIKEKFGSVYFHFDKPLSARQFFGAKLDRSLHNMRPLYQQEIMENEKGLIPPLAYKIVHRQQKCCVITVFNLMSFILNHNFSHSKELLTVLDLTREIRWLKSVIESFGAFVYTEDVIASVEECFIVHKNLIEVTADKTIRLVENSIVLDKFIPSQLKAHSLSEETLTYSVPFVTLQIYINPTLQYFIDATILILVLNCENGLNKEELFNRYGFLRSLFAMEFVNILPLDSMEFETAVHQSTMLNILKFTIDSQYQLGDNRKLQDYLCTAIEPFLVSYFIMLFILERVPLVSEEKIILATVQSVLETKINNKNEFLHPYCLNLDTLGNCLSSVTTMGALIRKRSNNKVVYKINRSRITEIKEKIEMYIPTYNIKNASIPHFYLQNKL